MALRLEDPAGHAPVSDAQLQIANNRKIEAAVNAAQAFPVGSVFIAVVSTNPATLLGYGTWTAFAAGRVLVGLDAGQAEFDTVEETGGVKTHTLASSEMPSHTHVQDSHTHADSAHAHGLTLGVGSAANTTATGAAGRLTPGTGYTGLTDPENAGIAAATATNQTTGGGGAHQNLQPYITVYMWKRTA